MSKPENQRIQVEFSVSPGCLQPGVPEVVYLMFRFKQPRVEVDEGRMPINTSFVLDRSGSMSGNKLKYTKQAVEFAVSHLDARDYASVVLFDHDVKVLAPHEQVVNKDSLIQLIKSVTPGGTTNLSGGLLMGSELVKKVASTNMVNRVILLTDGLANRGVTEPEALVSIVREINSRNVSLSTMGVGEGFAEDLLVDMAEAGNGNFYFIASPDEIPGIFEQELSGLLSVTGQNLRLGITPREEAEITRVLGYPVQPDGRAVKVNLPDMYSGDTKTVLAEAYVKPETKGKLPLAQVHFSYTDVTGKLSTVNYDVSVNLQVTDDPGELESGVDLQVQKEVEIFRAAEVKEEAMKASDSGNFEQAQKMLDEQREKLRRVYEATGDGEVKEELEKLSRDRERMSATGFDAVTRKEIKMDSYLSRKKR